MSLGSKIPMPVVGGPASGKVIYLDKAFHTYVFPAYPREAVYRELHAIQDPKLTTYEVATYELRQIRLAWNFATFEAYALVWKDTPIEEYTRAVVSAFVAACLVTKDLF